MKNSQTKIVIIIIAVLVVLVGVLAALNAKAVEEKKAMQNQIQELHLKRIFSVLPPVQDLLFPICPVPIL